MATATWANCQADFIFDGALIDLIVPGTNREDWETFWAALRTGPFSLHAYRDDKPISLPESVAWIMSERKLASIMVAIQVGSISVHCHFFGGDLELDIDPREIKDQVGFEFLLTIMRFVADILKKQVFAVPEGGDPEHSFLEVSPDGDCQFIPPAYGKTAE